MKSWTLFLTLALLMAIPASSVGAASNAAQRAAVGSYVVTNLLDPGVVTCDSFNCSLRAAIAAANMDHIDSYITFSSGLTGIITLTVELPLVIDAGWMTVIDAGPNWIDINGNDTVRLFSVGANAGLTLKGLILEHGYTPNSGGIILNQGVLSIIHSSLLRSQADRGATIYNMSVLSVAESFIAFNTALTDGGAIYNATGNATVTNTTIFNNTAPNGAAMANGSGWSISITNSTIAGNSATGASGGSVHNSAGSIFLRNTIVANPAQGANCSGYMAGIHNQGNNIDSAASCGWGSNLGSMSNTDPKLLPLSGSGPSTAFEVSLPSPVIDGVTNAPTNCPPVDQRGVSRPIDGNGDGVARCDIGAVEMPPGWLVFLSLVIR